MSGGFSFPKAPAVCPRYFKAAAELFCEDSFASQGLTALVYLIRVIAVYQCCDGHQSRPKCHLLHRCGRLVLLLLLAFHPTRKPSLDHVNQVLQIFLLCPLRRSEFPSKHNDLADSIAQCILSLADCSSMDLICSSLCPCLD